MAKDIEYERICKKIGFIPSEYKPDESVIYTEDDNCENPFSKLTYEENLYLIKNGYLNKQ